MTAIQAVTIKNPQVSTSLTDRRIKAMTFASQILKQAKDYNLHISRSRALSYAWKYINTHSNAYVIYFTKHDKNGNVKEHCKRIVQMDTAGHVTFTGTGSPLKPGQRLFVDLARHTIKTILLSRMDEADVKVNTIISTYEDRISAIF